LDKGNAARLQFGQHAEKYRKSRTHSDPAILDHIIGLMSPNGEEEGLDVGCGGGHMATTLAKSIRKLVATDITPEMLVQTSKLAEDSGLLNLRFCLADAQNLPFQSNALDIVSCRIVLHHVSDADRAVAEMVRVLKKGGRLFIQDILGFDDLLARSYMDEIESLRDPSHIKNYSMEEWKSFVCRGGLKVIHSEVVPGVYEFKEWTSRSGTPVDNVEKIKIRLENIPELVEKHLKTSYSGGEWSIQMRYILLLMTKT
jgi:ubiquinone/menaquinone biosynthesis C-methylase UbiE